jgi:hypothetical protein
MLRRKSANTRLLKLLFALPIIGVTVALNAETVNDYVFAGARKTVDNAVAVSRTDHNVANADTQTPAENATVKKEVNTEDMTQKKKIKVEGVVLDEKGEPVVGATVMGSDGKHGTVTDDKGCFVMTDAEEGTPLQIQYIDCRTKVVTASPKMKVTLKNDGSASKKAQTQEEYDFYIDGVKSSKSEMNKLKNSDIQSITVNNRTDNGKKKAIIVMTKKASQTE